MENPVTSTKINNKGSILMPNYVIFAGVNGARKLILFDFEYIKLSEEFPEGLREI